MCAGEQWPLVRELLSHGQKLTAEASSKEDLNSYDTRGRLCPQQSFNSHPPRSDTGVSNKLRRNRVCYFLSVALDDGRSIPKQRCVGFAPGKKKKKKDSVRTLKYIRTKTHAHNNVECGTVLKFISDRPRTPILEHSIFWQYLSLGRFSLNYCIFFLFFPSSFFPVARR